MGMTMAYPRRSFRDDEEVGKKYDDPRPSRDGTFNNATATFRLLPRRPRRVLLAIFGLVALVLFLKNVRSEGPRFVERMNHRIPEPLAPVQSSALPSHVPSPSPRPDEPELLPAPDHSYNAPVRFHFLSQSLRPHKGGGPSARDRSVIMLAAAALESVSSLLPLACEMARNEKYSVHFALMGRHTISIEGVREVNGVDQTECPLTWHDARPDYGPWSSDARMEESVKAGLGHIARYFYPRLVITHDNDKEESYFRKGAKRRIDRMRAAHIGLPSRASSFKWISKLDIGSLKAWNKVQIDILVHAPPQSAGGLVRLLKSLEGADYLGFSPSLTVELPSDTDPSVLKFLSTFNWPPNSHRRDFTIRRRIQRQKLTSEEAAVQTVDAVYPKDSSFSHILVLSPQTELAPSYYQYLTYTLLKYKHSSRTGEAADDLIGISLELPSTSPIDDKPFSYSPQSQTDEVPEFLWQMPNNNAALYFGDKWIEFQSFLSNRFLPSLNLKQKDHSRLISKKFPSWMEYMLEFMRARGYYLLFPAFGGEDDLSLAVVHRELYRRPEEYSAPSSKSTSGQNQQEDLGQDGELSDSDPLLSGAKALSESSTLSTIFHTFPGRLPNLSSLPVLSYNGERIASEELIAQTETNRKAFIHEIGGCKEGQVPSEVEPLKADDLFCYEDSGDDV